MLSRVFYEFTGEGGYPEYISSLLTSSRQLPLIPFALFFL